MSVAARLTPMETTRLVTEAMGTGLLDTMPYATSCSQLPGLRPWPQQEKLPVWSRCPVCGLGPNKRSSQSGPRLPLQAGRHTPPHLEPWLPCSVGCPRDFPSAASSPCMGCLYSWPCSAGCGPAQADITPFSLPLCRGGLHPCSGRDSGGAGRGHHLHHSFPRGGHRTEIHPPRVLHLLQAAVSSSCCHPVARECKPLATSPPLSPILTNPQGRLPWIWVPFFPGY